VAAIVGLAAAGLGITLLVTRPSTSKPAAPEPAATTPAPEPDPTPPPRFTPPPVAPTVEATPPAPAAEPAPAADEPSKLRPKKTATGKGKKGGEPPAGRTGERPSAPADTPAAPASRVNTERW
jgi:hypothetical protein